MLRLRTLTTRFGALYLFVIAIVGALTFVVLGQLAGIRVDLDRVMEETREQVVCSRIVSAVQSVDGILAEPGPMEDAQQRRARVLVKEALVLVANLAGGSTDPSRADHQEEEELITEGLVLRLEALARTLDGDVDEGKEAELRASLAAAEEAGRELLEEAREESEEAHDELSERTETSGWTMALTAAAASLLLLLALVLGRRWVIVPIRRLRDGAERVGRGERAHRIPHSGNDELDDLAATFNSMAERIAESQGDLEERVRARTEAFVKAARLADLGVLASGIAHEINTPLGSITSCAEGLRRRVERGDLSPEELDEYTRTIRAEAFRARDITQRMLGLVRQEPSHLSAVGVDAIVAQARAAVSHLAVAAEVELDIEVLADGELCVSRGELVQVLVNLLANGIDASGPGQRVRMTARVDAAQAEFEVCDEGEGVPPEHIERIFEPFFTTKGTGRGTGLGLALVATLLESRGGTIDVAGRRPRGTCFRVVVPRDWSPAA